MPNDKSFHMPSKDFKRYGYQIIDWIADYHERVEQMPVFSQVSPGEIYSKLPDHAPQQGDSFQEILKDIEKIIMPGITHWQSPNWYAFFPANTSGPSILGELLSAGLGVQGMLWATSPSCTELETRVVDWLVEMLDLPSTFKSDNTGGGVIQDSASSATLCALLAARERITGYSSNQTGCTGRLVAYASTQAHSSIEKAVKIAGIGSENLHSIGVDDQFAMLPDQLEQQVLKDKQHGLTPFFISANIGSTSSNALDPVAEIGEICRKHKMWLHVDAAMSGTAALCPEFRFIHRGLECADSYCFNPHKWMFTNFDCDVFYVKNRDALIRTFSLLPEYLRNKASESGEVFDYRDWHIQLGRRFRALKLWFVIRHYGIRGLQYHIREHVRLAQLFADWIRRSDDFTLEVEPPLNLVCFRHRGGDEINQYIMDTVNAGGKACFTHTRLNDHLVLRLSVGQTHTRENHVETVWQLIQQASRQYTSNGK